MNPADIIKDAVALIKEYAQELSQKEHRDDVESGELIGYTEAILRLLVYFRMRVRRICAVKSVLISISTQHT